MYFLKIKKCIKPQVGEKTYKYNLMYKGNKIYLLN